MPEPVTAELPCAKCGYDLRMQPREGICPECATPVQKAIELAAVPVRPAWRDTDPRWRRRMIAGAWVMALIPLMSVLERSGLAARLPVIFYEFRGFSTGRLEESFVGWVYTYLVFCIGVVLFFSKERGRQTHRLDWTRRWGVILSYLVLLLGVAINGLIIALVLVGITALFYRLPPADQPPVTDFLAWLSTKYIVYGPHDSEHTYALAAVASAGAVLLACVPIHQALRCSGAGKLAIALIVTLALLCAANIASIGFWYSNRGPVLSSLPPMFFFEPGWLVLGLAHPKSIGSQTLPLLSFIQEAAKWLIFLIVALWLTAAQVRAWRKWPPREVVAP